MKAELNRINLTRTLALTALVSTMPAQAHHFMEGNVPTTSFQGFLSGIAHPVIGVDHLAFVLLVGLLSFAFSGINRFLVPLAFVAAALGGTALHLAAFDLPMVEAVIAVSVIVGGVLVFTRTSLPALAAAAGMGAFGLYHGYAYGESIVGAETGPLTSYLAGYSLVQYAIVVGVVLGAAYLARHSEHLQSVVARTGGIFATVIGSVFLVGNLA